MGSKRFRICHQVFPLSSEAADPTEFGRNVMTMASATAPIGRLTAAQRT